MRSSELQIKKVLRIFIYPKSKNRDSARREFILNTLLSGSIVLALAAFTQNIVGTILTPQVYVGITPVITFVCLVVLCLLLLLSRMKKPTLAALIFIILLLLPSMYASFRWGADLPQSLMMYALLIVMGGILIGTRFAFILTGFISMCLVLISIVHINNMLPLASSWKELPYNYGDTIMAVITLVIIALVSWMSNREIEKSLRRARASEKALIKERDQLEITVQKRTQELRLAQVEQMMQLYRFAEIGKMASGLFHDLAVPLNLVSLNLDRMNKQSKSHQTNTEDLSMLITRATNGTKHLHSFLDAARRQIQNQEIFHAFSLGKEIRYVLPMFDYRAKELKVVVTFIEKGKVKVFGNPVKFNQVITNLLANALDAYDTTKKLSRREVVITLEKSRSQVRITIEDWGSGIKADMRERIFQPFVTTKKVNKGTGIGLSISKTIIERDFKGRITFQEKEGLGTAFVIEFPHKQQ